MEVGELSSGISLLGSRSWEDAREHPQRTPARAPRRDRVRARLAARPDRRALPRLRRGVVRPGRPLIDAVASLCSRIHADFEYKPGSTSVATPLTEVFAKRHGVCQDFAHLGIACLRSLGLAARYVSGYLETEPAPGRQKLTGVDGSHAWLSVLIPEAGWLDVDPTNDQFAGDRYIVTAYGRDYGDVPPLGGVIYTEGKTEGLRVAVDVVPMSG